VRTYGQYCALARALDVVGDRWTLLLVRELFAQQPCRYTDLRYGLPGIASNLLVERLRELEEEGIVTREAAPPPVATTLFRLTPRGEKLRPVLEALGEWGRPLLESAGADATFRSHWLTLPLELQLRDSTPDAPPVTIEVHTAEKPVVVQTVDGDVRVRPGTCPAPDATVTGDPAVVLGFLLGGLDLAAARKRGLVLEGDEGAVRRLQPAPA
jgi:DNA-binding HxlR family transcriptional regulator